MDTPLTIDTVSINDLEMDPENARLHPKKNLDAICGSLELFGQREPLVVQRGTNRVIGGNGRLEAMRQLGWGEVTVAYVDCTAAEATALGLALNRTAETAKWDTERLDELLDRCRQDGLSTSSFGFDDKAVDDIIARAKRDEEADEAYQASIAEHIDPASIEEDEIPEPPKEPKSKKGDLYRMGEHLLLCGDSTMAHDYERLMGADKADMIATDPPYGVSYVGGTKDALTIQNDGAAGLEELLRDSFTLAIAHTRPGAVWYVAAPAGPQFLSFAIVLSELDVWRQTLVWLKNSLVMGHSDFHYRHEAIFYGWTPGAAHKPPADRKQDTIWECDRPSRSPDHPTMKPIKLYARMIDHSSKPGDIVLEMYSGSGTTLLACEEMGRRFRGIEIDPRFIDVAVRRWEDRSGQKAELVQRDG